MKRFYILAALCATCLTGNETLAKPVCNEQYVVGHGDTLSKIARNAYQDTSLWPYIYGYGSNAAAMGGNPSLLSAGTVLQLPPCPRFRESITGKRASASDDLVPQRTDRIEILTAGDYPPFTDQAWDNGGMLTEVVNAAFEGPGGAPVYSVDWVNDWSAHIDPLLRRHKYSMGFPWFKPNCEAPATLTEEDKKHCEFYFSEPLFEMPIILFKRTGDQTVLATDDDLHGKHLCRPAGHFTFDLTTRGLIPGDTIELDTPQDVADCFHKLVDGDVDFVTMNQFTGRSVIKKFGYGAYVEASTDLAEQLGLHLIIHRDHPKAKMLLRQFDRGLAKLKNSGRYDDIIERHLAIYQGQNS